MSVVFLEETPGDHLTSHILALSATHFCLSQKAQPYYN